ncbi:MULTISPECIES: PaaI family thioesterase [Nocardia]|uniref:PaaI family thioesterase n=1 Tax=Nocardia aurea TaxID=2144174 RepID=A0ABV3FVV3_9NOCA|nr:MULTISPECIES: PaaI family thioesterase [Nocardia]
MQLNDELLYAVAPFAETLGVRIEEASAESVRVRLAHREQLGTMGGGMHGGALMSLCDIAAALCAATRVEPGQVTTTAESSTYFLAPLRGDSATAVARPVRVGRTLICVEVDVHDAQGRHCARTTQLLAVTQS